MTPGLYRYIPLVLYDLGQMIYLVNCSLSSRYMRSNFTLSVNLLLFLLYSWFQGQQIDSWKAKNPKVVKKKRKKLKKWKDEQLERKAYTTVGSRTKFFQEKNIFISHISKLVCLRPTHWNASVLEQDNCRLRFLPLVKHEMVRIPLIQNC